MSIITLPTAVRILRVDWGQRRYDLRFESGDAGAGQTRVLAPPRWTAGIVCPEQMSQADAAAWRDLILSLSGQINQLALHDLGNPAPRGTMRGTLTLNTAVAAGDLVFSITGGAGQAATTLLQGDWFGIGSGATRQLLPVAADATANGSGVISVTSRVPARWAQLSGSSVVWDKPTALFRQTTQDSKWSHERAIRTGYSLDLIESWET